MEDREVFAVPLLNCELITKKGDVACEALLFVTKFCLNDSADLRKLEKVTSVCSKNSTNGIVSGLELPVMIDAGNEVIHSGLSICCRIVIQKSVTAFPQKRSQIQKLLGFKCTLLKNYESRCDWRYLFERGLPNLFNLLLLDQEGTSSPNCDDELRESNAKTMLEYLTKLDNNLVQPAIIFNAPGVAKRLLKKCEKRKMVPEIELADLERIVRSDLWYADSGRFREVLTHDCVPNIFFAGLEPSVVDFITFYYLNKIITVSNVLDTVDFSKFPQLVRWVNLFMMTFPEFLADAYSEVNLSTLNYFRLLRNSWTIDSLIPPTDVKFEKNPPDKNQGRWLPRGGKRNNLVSIVKHALNDPAFKQHPGFDWMAKFDWKSVPEFADVFNFVPESRSERKRSQVLNMVAAIATITEPKSVVVDFCSGGGHVGLLLAHTLPSCQIILLDNKLESLEEARNRIQMGKLSNVKLVHCSIEQFTGHFDVGVSLHACGPSTDIVLAMCYNKNAGFVVCPCCYGNIRFVEDIQYPRSELFRSKDITAEEFHSLTKGADNSGDSEQRDDCMRLVDYDRLSEARELGYCNLMLTRMEPSSCSPKNSILIGSKAKVIQVDSL